MMRRRQIRSTNATSTPPSHERKARSGYSLSRCAFLLVIVIGVFFIVTIPLKMKKKKQAIGSIGSGNDDALYGLLGRLGRTEVDDTEYHVVFSTSCSPFQDWQSIVFFYHAKKVKQPGTVTRIAAGCTDEQQQSLQKVHKEQIEPLSKDFYLHFTPDFATKGHYESTKYFNKPFGVRHWMENALGYPSNRNADDAVIVILDPDMLLTKPLTRTFAKEDLWRVPKGHNGGRVEHGAPIAQVYGFHSAWLSKTNVTFVAGADSPAHSVSMQDAEEYNVGPPYIVTSKDMYDIVVKWTEFLPLIYEGNRNFMSEMYAYSLAAAHLRLPHAVSNKLMVSDVGSLDLEGWDFLESRNRDQVCLPIPVEQLPPVLHYCQRYALGKWFFSKYKVPTDFFSCQADLLKVPPIDLAVKYNFYIFPDGGTMNYTKDMPIKQHGFMTCKIISALNEVAEYYKRNHCPEGANFNKSFIFHEVMDV